ncbi:hypothetical protein Q5Y75_07850 [Ruegeria sp. 2205SS24-7]|uniref:hypothetical protein n=1 Tax=Ruegeria discodermiae TaxID=3064389 RepID=UPI002740B3EA|nr:hypothetical protein [Ruegeria sp. 2205SS24-7]MDP5217126.1 hypothetical protein [Ruegeria sp. 2205SS24-7]
MASREYVDLVNSLRGQSEAEALALAARSSLRVLPVIADVQSDNLNAILLPLLRATIVHSAVLLDPSSEARAAARSAAQSIASVSASHKLAESAVRQTIATANGLARSASFFRGNMVSSKEVADAAADAVRAARKASEISESEIFADWRRLGSPVAPLAHFDQPLWSTPSAAMEKKRNLLTRHWISKPDVWDFWRYWYRGYHIGKPLDWELQRRVALIPTEDWEQGQAHIAGRIAEIQANQEVRSRIGELEAELSSSAASRFGIGGNHPPEAIIETAIPRPNELIFVWEPMTELMVEAQAASPDPDRVQDILDRLVAALKMGLEWVASKIDLAVDTAIKWGIPAIGGGYFALNPSKLEAVVNAGEAWLVFLR